MKNVNCLTRFNLYLFEMCFPKELLCGFRNKCLCVSFRKLVPLRNFAPVVKIT